MLVLGALSGIQSYVFDVAETGGGQACRLRARSFFVQVFAEAALLRLLRALDWRMDESHVLLASAGKFTLKGRSRPGVDDALEQERRQFDEWFLRETQGGLRLALAWTGDDRSFRAAQAELRRTRARPWAPTGGKNWDPARLVLPPLNDPCDLCRRAPAVDQELSEDGSVQELCRWCAQSGRLGRRLPRARWLVFRNAPTEADLDILGFGVDVSDAGAPPLGPDVSALADLHSPGTPPAGCPPERFLVRRLAAHVPTDNGRPVEFVDLARQSTGDHLLGVLKADADSLGIHIDRAIGPDGDPRKLARFSGELDEFLASQLQTEIQSDSRWRSIYTIFAGGDDLVMVGPWNVMLDFAGRMQDLFRDSFAPKGMTLSAGLAVFKPKAPIKTAVGEAGSLLEAAKTRAAPGESLPKDQFAAFGQIWKWKVHRQILKTGKQLVEWVVSGQMDRGQLHTILGLAQARHAWVSIHAAAPAKVDPLATARLAHHVARNYRRGTPVRSWAEGILQRFDDPADIDVRYLPSAVRYALAASRALGEEE